MNIVFLARSLNVGGAERQLTALAAGLAKRGHRVTVCLLYGGGAFDALLRDTGVSLHTLEKTGRWDLYGPIRRWLRLVRAERPDIVHGYLPVPNLLAALVGLMVRGPRVVFGVRASDMDLGRYDRLSALTYRLEAAAAAVADLVIANSHAGLAAAWTRGFPRRGRVIANGIDTDRFRPDPAAGARKRAAWGIGDGVKTVGVIARLDPMKGHPIFLEAAARMAATRSDLRFVCIGDGPGAYGGALREQARALGLADRLDWFPSDPDLPACYCALDLLVSSSVFGEGFSNVLGEAMACGIPVVATDVGDARAIVGEAGRIVPAGDPSAIAEAALALLDAPPANPRAQARRFGATALVDASEAALMALLAPKVVHVVTSLDTGGAERTLVNLATSDSNLANASVVSLKAGGDLVPVLVQAGIEVRVLGMDRPGGALTALPRLAAFLALRRPDWVMTWLYHADLVGTVAHGLAGGPGRLAWNVRCSAMDLRRYRPTTRWVLRALVWLSSRPERIVVNSAAGRAHHQSLGYRPPAWSFIPNGIDTGRFRPDLEARQQWRRCWGVAAEAPVAGLIARADPMKGHGVALEAVALARQQVPELRLVMVGRGIGPGNRELTAAIDRLGLAAAVIRLERSDQIPAIMAALDIVVMASLFGEGFPNVVAEAMATGIPCLVTDVGDAAVLVGECGLVVPPDDVDALAGSLAVLSRDARLRGRLGGAARARIEVHFTQRAMVEAYARLWRSPAFSDQPDEA